MMWEIREAPTRELFDKDREILLEILQQNRIIIECLTRSAIFIPADPKPEEKACPK